MTPSPISSRFFRPFNPSVSLNNCICARNNSDFIETFSREKNRPHKKLDISVVSRDSSSKIKREEKF